MTNNNASTNFDDDQFPWYEGRLIRFRYPANGKVIAFPHGDGNYTVRVMIPKEDGANQRFNWKPLPADTPAKLVIHEKYENAVELPGDEINKAPYLVNLPLGHVWRCRRWLYDGGRLVGILETACVDGTQSTGLELSWLAKEEEYLQDKWIFDLILATCEWI